MYKKIQSSIALVMSVFMFCTVFMINSQSVYALADGAYIVGRTVSYTNPQTGETVDGGSNIALGESMANSIVENTVLVEKSGGKTYVTMGLGMMSSISKDDDHDRSGEPPDGSCSFLWFITGISCYLTVFCLELVVM